MATASNTSWIHSDTLSCHNDAKEKKTLTLQTKLSISMINFVKLVGNKFDKFRKQEESFCKVILVNLHLLFSTLNFVIFDFSQFS